MNAVVNTDRFDPVAIADCCRSSRYSDDHHLLTAALAAVGEFHVVQRGRSWYRLGRVIDAAGAHVCVDLDAWARKALASFGDDLEAFTARYKEADYSVTRFDGYTLYLAAPVGAKAAEFIQLDIEVVQEVLARPLLDSEALPMDVEELIDPCHSYHDGRPLNAPRYALRRITDTEAFIAAMDNYLAQVTPPRRMVQAWEASSASQARFCRHWAFQFSEHEGVHGECHRRAKPLSALPPQAPQLEQAGRLSPVQLGSALRRFDHHAGYPFAWFFHLLTGQGVSHEVGASVGRHLQQGYRYLPDADIDLLTAWLRAPYTV